MTRKLSLRFLITAVVYFLAACTLGIGMLFQVFPITRDVIVSHAHIALLGFVSATIIGTMYQQVPTFTSADLYSKILGEISFWMLNLGLIGFVVGITTYGFEPFTLLFSLFLLIAVYAFAANIFLTVKNKRAWTFTLWFYVMSVVYLVLGSTLGLIIVLMRMEILELWRILPSSSKLIASHAHIGALGWISVIIIGAMSWMLPMVVMKDIYSERLVRQVFWVFNAGVVGFFLSLIATGFGVTTIIFAIIVIIGTLLFTYLMYKTASGESKMKMKVTSTEAKFLEAAILYFLAVVIVGLVMLLNRDILRELSFGHVHLAMLGWVSLTIFGGMYHLIPMLTWANMAEKKVKSLPSNFKELYSERLSWVIFILANIGIVGLFLGSLISVPIMKASALVFFLSALIFSFEMLNIARKGIF